MEIKISVKNKIAKPQDLNAFIVCGNSDIDIVFDFDEEWQANDVKTARFSFDGKHIDVLFTGNAVKMPIIQNTTVLEIGVYSGNLHTTTGALIAAKKSILCGSGVPVDPPEDVYNQIIEQLNELRGFISNIAGDIVLYTGKYTVIPKVEAQTLNTENKLLLEDVSITEIPRYDVSNQSGGETVYIGSEVEING